MLAVILLAQTDGDEEDTTTTYRLLGYIKVNHQITPAAWLDFLIERRARLTRSTTTPAGRRFLPSRVSGSRGVTSFKSPVVQSLGYINLLTRLSFVHLLHPTQHSQHPPTLAFSSSSILSTKQENTKTFI